MQQRNIGLPELVSLCETDNITKRDFSVKAPLSRFNVTKEELKYSFDETMLVDNKKLLEVNKEGYTVSPIAFNQICQKLDIPIPYLKRCPPGLQVTNLNHWLERYSYKHSPHILFVRTRDTGMVRAFLSNRYYPVDNIEIAKSINENIADKFIKISRVDIEEELFTCYIKTNTTTFEGAELRVESGVVNSEVGVSSLIVEYLLTWKNKVKLLLPRDFIGAELVRTKKIKPDEVQYRFRHLQSNKELLSASVKTIMDPAINHAVMLLHSEIIAKLSTTKVSTEAELDYLKEVFGIKLINELGIKLDTNRGEVLERLSAENLPLSRERLLLTKGSDYVRAFCWID